MKKKVRSEEARANDPNPGDNCLSSNSTVDGRFSVSFDLDSAWLDPVPGAPAPPENLRTTVGKDRAALSWKGNSKDHDSYEVLQYLGGDWQVIAQKGKGARRAVVTGLTSGTQYQFAVRSCLAGFCCGLVKTSLTTK